ncbi:MAG TPA: RNase P subunit p30 family protein [Methanomicrobiales archaeon]|nr:RNase P subunit p30 family protein [Methanomicrobiales archaeon]
MDCADACVHPYPDGDSSVGRMAIEAGDLGFTTIVAVDRGSFQMEGVSVLQGVVIHENTVKGVTKEVNRALPRADVLLADAGDQAFNRGILSIRGIHILRQVHRTPRNSFDHITARIASERRVAVEIDLYPLIHSRGLERQKVLRRYADILRLQRRYDFPLALSSNARSILDLRSPRESMALCSLFGMEEPEVTRAFMNLKDLLSPRGAVQVVE